MYSSWFVVVLCVNILINQGLHRAILQICVELISHYAHIRILYILYIYVVCTYKKRPKTIMIAMGILFI